MASLYGVGTYSKGNYSAPDYVDVAGRQTFDAVFPAATILGVLQIVDLVPIRLIVNTHLTGFLGNTNVYLQGSLEPSIAMTGKLTPYANLAGSFRVLTGVASADLGKEELITFDGAASINMTFGQPVLINAGWKPSPPCGGDWTEDAACPVGPWTPSAAPPSPWTQANG